MPPGSDQEKTEKATPKKQDDARKKGQVSKSRDICSVAVLLACLMGLNFLGESTFLKLSEIMKSNLLHLDMAELNTADVIQMSRDTIFSCFVIISPFMALAVFAGLFSNVVQVGFLVSPESLKIDFSKISPLKGFQRLFSLRSLVELAKSIFKLAVVGGVAFLTVNEQMDEILPLVTLGIWDILSFIAGVSYKILIRTCWMLILLAVLDYAYQKYEHQKNLKMSKQEVKDEHKQAEGDPLVRSRIRSLQREMARKRMMEEVPKADVVITNPTHFAVAIQYKEKMGAPIVVAKGAGLLAQKIKEVARKNKVVIVENRRVARLLYKVCDVGMEIPENLYRAVAEILAHVYRLKGKVN